jgi:glutamyl-tRNA reductase
VAERLGRIRYRGSCTGSPLPIIGLGMVERAIKARRHRPMVMVDLAVPRDIESEVGELDDVFLYTVDDLGQVVESGLESRQAAVIEAEGDHHQRVETFFTGSRRASGAAIAPCATLPRRVRRHEMEHAMKLLAKGESTRQSARPASRMGLTNKFLHAPTHALESSRSDERADIAALMHACTIFPSTD